MHTNAGKKTAGTESRENVHTQKFSDTAINTGTVKGTVHRKPKDTVIAKGTDTQSLALKQATEWHMGVKRAQSRENNKNGIYTGENIAKKVQGNGTKRGWAHKIDTGATKYRNCSN